MNKKILGAVVVVIATFLLGCASKTDNADYSTYIARQWVESNIDVLSDRLSKPISDAYPSVPTFAIKAVLKNVLSGLKWDYSPRKLGSEDWRVAVTTSMNFTLPVANEIIDLKGGLNLRVDTKNARVTDVSIDPDHYKFTHTPKVAPQQTTWTRMKDNTESVTYFYLGSMKRSGDIVSNIALMDDRKSVAEFDGKQYLSTITTRSCNCRESTYRVDVLGIKGGQMGAGDDIGVVSLPSGEEWKSTGYPDSYVSVLCKRACRP